LKWSVENAFFVQQAPTGNAVIDLFLVWQSYFSESAAARLKFRISNKSNRPARIEFLNADGSTTTAYVRTAD
jgi:hypothetical protein